MRYVVLMAALAGLLVNTGCEQKPSMTPSMTPVQRGEYLVKTSACSDCHTPLRMGNFGPEPDLSRKLSGHPQDITLPAPPALPVGPWVMMGSATNTAFAGPWGISFATNLTPDTLTGIGTWTEEMFIKAIRTGKHMATSRPIMPPMPWQAYSQMVDEDLKAVYAYLRSIPPFRNQAPEYQPAPQKEMESESIN